MAGEVAVKRVDFGLLGRVEGIFLKFLFSELRGLRHRSFGLLAEVDIEGSLKHFFGGQSSVGNSAVRVEVFGNGLGRHRRLFPLRFIREQVRSLEFWNLEGHVRWSGARGKFGDLFQGSRRRA